SSTYRLQIFNDDVLFQSSNIRLLFDITVHPIISLGILLGIVGLLLGYNTKKILIMSILNGVIFSIMTLGRWYFLRTFLFLIIGYFLIKQKNILPQRKSNKNNRLIKIVTSAVVIALVFMSNFRAQKNS